MIVQQVLEGWVNEKLSVIGESIQDIRQDLKDGMSVNTNGSHFMD